MGTVAHRNQWATLNNYLTTSQFGVSYPFIGDGTRNTNYGGIGVYANSTSLLDNQISFTDFYLSASYNLEISDMHNLIFGLDGGILQGKISSDQLTTGNQYIEGFGENMSLENLIILEQQNYSAPDFNFGLHYNLNQNFNTREGGDNLKVSTGLVINHLTQPKTSFLSNDDISQLRTNFYVFTEHRIASKIFLCSQINYNKQQNSSQTQLGLFGRYILRDKEESLLNTNILFGSYLRFNDAIIPYVNLEFKNFGIGLSYDITISPLKNHNNSNGAWEIVFYGLIKKEAHVKKGKKGGARFDSDL